VVGLLQKYLPEAEHILHDLMVGSQYQSVVDHQGSFSFHMSLGTLLHVDMDHLSGEPGRPLRYHLPVTVAIEMLFTPEESPGRECLVRTYVPAFEYYIP